VQTTATIVYNSLQTGVYDAVIGYVSLTKALKLHEMAKYHTKVGFGAMTWLYVHMSMDAWNKLPPDVQKVVAEVGRDFEEVLAQETQERYQERIAQIEAEGAEIITIPDDLRKQWAESLKDWPNEKAKEVDKLGWPGSEVAKRNLAAAERHGHVWPVRYVIE
jgi:TRAP-type C4-dicarboxylate transport system substrate-binding protein